MVSLSNSLDQQVKCFLNLNILFKLLQIRIYLGSFPNLISCGAVHM